MSNISVRVIQHPELKYISPLKCRFCTHSQIFVRWFLLLCVRVQPHNVFPPCQLRSVCCRALRSHSLKASWVIECLSEIPACPSSFISHAAGLMLSSQTLIGCGCLHVLTVCLRYLQCRCAQTAQAELKHINHSRWLQLNYKDTQFLFCLIMLGLLEHAYRWCCVSTEPPLICLTTRRPYRCWVLLLLQGNEEITALFTFN